MKAVFCNKGEDLEHETYTEGLTIGKAYEILAEQPRWTMGKDHRARPAMLYYIENDRGIKTKYNQSLFCSIEEWRDRRLEEIIEQI